MNLFEFLPLLYRKMNLLSCECSAYHLFYLFSLDGIVEISRPTLAANTGDGEKVSTQGGEDKKPPVQQADSALPTAPRNPPTVTIDGVPTILIIGTDTGKPCYIDPTTHKLSELNICFLLYVLHNYFRKYSIVLPFFLM